MKFIIYLCLALPLLAENVLTGIIKPIHDVSLSVSVDGVVEKVILKEGSSVKKGEVILKLDEKLQKLETKRRAIVWRDKTTLHTVEQNLEIMKKLFERKEKLYYETKAVSETSLNQAKMEYIKAEGELFTLQESEKREKLEFDISKEVLAYYSLKSPIDGVVTEIKPSIGEWVQTGAVVVKVVDTKVCFVEVDADVAMVAQANVGDPVSIEVDSGEGAVTKEGQIDFISVVADSASSLVRVKVSFENNDSKVLPGVTARVVF